MLGEKFPTISVTLLVLYLSSVHYAQSKPVKRNYSPAMNEEATKIALETTGQLLPDIQMVDKIRKDLKLIRRLDKKLRKRIHVGKWKPGELLVKNISDKQFREIESSEFKPVSLIDSNQSQEDYKILKFLKPFHPEHLSRLLHLRFNVESKPNFIEKSKNDNVIAYRHDLSTYYWNPVNGKNCKTGCLTQYSVSVNVIPRHYFTQQLNDLF